MNVTLRQMRCFVEVARQGNFTRAAHALSLSQPALTITINQFEDLLGVRLFDRTTRRVRLTAAGEEFLPSVERLLHDLDAALAGMRDVAAHQRGRVALAALPSLAINLLPEIIAQFNGQHPHIHVHLRDDNASGIQDRVRRNQVDFGLGSRWGPLPELDFHPLFSDPFGAVCRRDHPLARERGPIAWRKLQGHAFLGLGPDTGIRHLLQGVQGLPENVLSPLFEVSNIATLQGMLRAGLGITVLPALAVPGPDTDGLVFRRLTRPALHRELGVITRRGRSLSPAAQALHDLMTRRLSAPAARAQAGSARASHRKT